MKWIIFIGASLLIGVVSGQLSSSRNQDCKDNESFNTCGSACEPSCDNPNPSFCTLQCVVGCQCNSGFLRRSSDKACVPQAQCSTPVTAPPLPPPNNTCGANEENNQCHNPCTEKKCPQKNAPLVNCLMACMVGCSCKSGFVRNLKGECVKESACPAIDNSTSTENPCNLADCRTGFKCVPQNGQATCIPVPDDQPPTGITCANVRCAGMPCAMVEPVGCPGCKQQPQCLPVNKCDSMKCKYTEECVLVQVTCVKAPCYPVAECRPKKNVKPLTLPREPRQTTMGPSCMTARCGTPGGCAMTRPSTCETRDANGKCPLQVGCVDENPCAATSCLVGTQCVLHEVQCIRAPCPPIAQCEPLNDAPAPGDKRCKGKNEKYIECKTMCSDTNCNEEPKMCKAVCTGGGCACQEGFFRNKRGQCVTQNQCDIEQGK